MTKYKQIYSLDDPRATLVHRDIILSKPFLKRLYHDWYSILIQKAKAINGNGQFLEIGSGGGYLKSLFPEIITSDILDLPHVDIICNAEELPFEKDSLTSILMVNVFHHIPHPYKFLKEAERTLIHGGKILMIEPANTLLSRFIYKNFHHEPFDPSGPMEITPGNPLSNSNQALPYIYFEREKKSFDTKYPLLKLRVIKHHSPFLYAISGGLSRSELLPYCMYGVIKGLETIVSPLANQLGLFCLVEIEKTNTKYN